MSSESPYALIDASGRVRCVDRRAFEEAVGTDYCCQLVPSSPLERTYTVFRVQDADSLEYVRPFVDYPSVECSRLGVVRHTDLSGHGGWRHYTSTMLPMFDVHEPDHEHSTVDMDPTDLLWCRTLINGGGNYGVDVKWDPERLLHVWMQRRQTRAHTTALTVHTQAQRGFRLCAPRIDGLRVAASSDLEALAYHLAFSAARPAHVWKPLAFTYTRCRTWWVTHRQRSRGETMVCVEADGTLCYVHNAVRYIATMAYDCQCVDARA